MVCPRGRHVKTRRCLRAKRGCQPVRQQTHNQLHRNLRRPTCPHRRTSSMKQIEQEFGKPNPDAPVALSRFGFLIGRWRCEARVRAADEEWQTLQATWLGRFVLEVVRSPTPSRSRWPPTLIRAPLTRTSPRITSHGERRSPTMERRGSSSWWSRPIAARSDSAVPRP